MLHERIPQTLDKEDLEPCTQQEADGRIILHVAGKATINKGTTIQSPGEGDGVFLK